MAWNGWLETAPVRVGVLLAHDDADDACDALLQPDLRFDLRPLREAYEKAYGRGPSTLILEITDPAQPSGPALASLSWQF